MDGTSIEDFGSSDPSLETTVPTDLTVSQSESDENGNCHNKQDRITKYLLLRKQLSHDIQCLKIELSQRNMTIDNMKLEHMSAIENLEEKLNEAIHRKKIAEATLENQLRLNYEENKIKERKFESELKVILEKQKQLEEVNRVCTETADDVKRSLDNLHMSSAEYSQLKATDASLLNIKQYAAIKVYEAVKSLSAEKNEIANSVTSLKNDTHSLKIKNQQLQLNVQALEKERTDITKKYEEAVKKLKVTFENIEEGNYKIENFERVKKERDAMKQLNLELSNQLASVQANFKILSQEKDDFKHQCNGYEQQLALMTQNKETLARNMSELLVKNGTYEDRCSDLTLELDKVKQAKDLLYEKYISSRESYKAEYERKMEQKVDDIRLKTTHEIDKIQTTVRDMYERQIRTLKESMCVSERAKQHAELAEKDSLAKYEKLLVELKTLQAQDISQISELKSELKVKVFQLEQLVVNNEELNRSLQCCTSQQNQLKAQYDDLSQQSEKYKMNSHQQIADLQSQLKSFRSQLDVYEQLEDQLDDGVIRLANGVDMSSAEQLLSVYGNGGLISTTAKRRLEQSMNLSKQVFSLKKQLAVANEKLEKQIKECNDLKEQLKSANEAISVIKQPQSYIVHQIQNRDKAIQDKNSLINKFQIQIEELNQEKDGLIKVKNDLNHDLDKLLNNREELNIIKNMLMQVQDAGLNHQTETNMLKQKPTGSSTPENHLHAARKPKTIKFTNKKPPFH